MIKRHHLAEACLACEDHAAARDHAQRAAAIHRETGHALAEERANAVAARAVRAQPEVAG
jgi:hypothetical protein